MELKLLIALVKAGAGHPPECVGAAIGVHLRGY